MPDERNAIVSARESDVLDAGGAGDVLGPVRAMRVNDYPF